MNLLVAETEIRAEIAADAFGFKREEWMSVGYAAALTGRRFDKVVVLRPTGRDFNDHEKQWMREVLPLKLPPDGRVWYV